MDRPEPTYAVCSQQCFECDSKDYFSRILSYSQKSSLSFPGKGEEDTLVCTCCMAGWLTHLRKSSWKDRRTCFAGEETEVLRIHWSSFTLTRLGRRGRDLYLGLLFPHCHKTKPSPKNHFWFFLVFSWLIWAVKHCTLCTGIPVCICG